MKNFYLVLTALILCAIVLFLNLLGPVDQYKGEESTGDALLSEIGEGEKEEAAGAAEWIPVFDLKYTEYLIPEPYEYDVEGESRRFRFSEMLSVVTEAEKAAERGRTVHIDNYKNRNGIAPLYKGKTTDSAGNSRSASAPAYYDTGNKEEFVYIADGTLVELFPAGEGADEGYAKVSVVGDEESVYFVPDKYVAEDDPLTMLSKAIVVDIENQNIAAFERYDDEEAPWRIVSYSLATTGKEGKYHRPTPKGYFFGIEKKERFYYLKDGTDTIEGYAPYAIRFTQGAYIHGVATAYKYQEDGSIRDPGIFEFSHTIGTVPLSHKCVRNYTSHAKFLYDWYEHGETIVIVI